MDGSRNRVEAINRILRNLTTENPEISAAALVSDDGLLLASALPQNLEEQRVGGMSATLLALGQRAVNELALGSTEQVLIKGTSGYVVLSTAAQGTVLLLLTSASAKLGLVFLDMGRAVQQLGSTL